MPQTLPLHLPNHAFELPSAVRIGTFRVLGFRILVKNLGFSVFFKDLGFRVVFKDSGCRVYMP